MTAQNTLQLQDLHCTLGSRPVLRGLSLRPLVGGQIVAVVGRNGAGKSTLLRSIAGFARCTAAKLQLGATDLRPLKAAARAASVRYLPQAAPGALHLTVQDCLLVALHAPRNGAAGDPRERIAETAGRLGLDDLLDRNVDELSGGQKQLVWLAQALLHRPRALLLDEPLTALDPHHQHHVMMLLRRLARERDLVIVVVLHDLNMAIRYADQAIVLREGVLVAQGPVDQALSPDVLAQAFLVESRLEQCSRGTPYIVIDDLLTL